ncbi:MAG: ribosome silencing factor RsfS [Ramlibacter sp.]|jgi:ribosome-associated protein|nr:ribosome silencing factor RsfS [Ramlibacter sp.]
MTQDASAKKDTQKLQRAIVDGLEDVKAQDIQVFNTEHLSPLFERVIVASGTSNRQTKALASSVRDAVREAGFPKPRIEGEENGEWIIVDCGAAVAHIMQPAIRQYYHLEEIWGDKPVRLKFGAPKPAEASPPPVKAPAKKAARKSAEGEMTSLRRSSAAKSAVKAAEREAKEEKARATPARKGAARPTVGRTRARPAGKTAARPAAKTAAKTGAKTAASKPTLKVVGKPAARKAPAKKTASRAPGRKT